MLFLLTGDVQIGKTRWLEGLVAALADVGVGAAGVVAPGQWVPSAGPEADANGYEKLGIDNLLLPEGRRVPFARRRDLAHAEGSFDEGSQAARAQLAWHIFDDAIGQVNEHFEQLAADACKLAAADVARESAAVAAEGSRGSLRPHLLVVDELGRLELWKGEGLTAAVALLQQGPSAAFPHALVVVRDYLLPEARQLLEPAWGPAALIGPTPEAAQQVLQAFAHDRGRG